MSRALVLLIEAQAFHPDGTDAPLIRLAAGDNRADHFDEQWLPALTQLPVMGARLGFNGVSFQAPVTSTTGNFAFSLAVGDLERAADLVWDGADIKIYQGFAGDDDQDFNLLWHGRSTASQATSDTITVTLADPAKDLERPVLGDRFEGTGGIEGGEDLKGRLKPKAWGFCENIPAILVDPANLVYRLIDGPSTISLVKDGGVPFNFGVDYPDYASLVAASIPDGQVGICSNLSLVKPWRAPRFALTADITAFGPMRIGDIAQNLVAGASGVTFAPGVLNEFNALQPSHASSYVSDETTVAQELDRLFGGVGAWWMPDAQGEIRVGQVGFGTVMLNVVDSVETITRNRVLPPTHQRILGYRPNYTPLSEGDIGGAVQAGDIDDLGALATQSTINWDNQVVGRPLNFRVVSHGTSSTTHPRSSGLWDDVDTQLAGPGRTYTVNVMDRATRNWISHTAYDLLFSAANAQSMADELNALGSDKIVVIYTDEEPQSFHTATGVATAMKRCGASRAIYESANFKTGSAYILIGIPGIGEGNGVELYAGDEDNDPDAWIDTSFTVDTLGNLQLTSTNVRDALDISYSDGTVIEDVQPEEAGANVTGNNVAAGFSGQGPLATAETISEHIANNSNLLQFIGGGLFNGDLNAEANLAASNALNKGWMTDDLKHWFTNTGATVNVSNFGAFHIVNIPDGVISGTAIRRAGGLNGFNDLFSEKISIDPSRNYQVTLWARQTAGTGRSDLSVAFFRADQSLITGADSNATGWDNISIYHRHLVVDEVFPAEWTKYQFTFGAQGRLGVPNASDHQAAFAQIAIEGPNLGFGTEVEIQGFRLDEIADATQLINGPAEAGAQANRPGQNLLNSDAGPEHTATYAANVGGWTHVYLDRVKLEDLSLLPGETTLSFSCDLRTDGVDGAQVRIRFYDAAGAQLVEYPTAFTYSTSYIRVELENMQIPVNATEIHLAVDDNYATGGQTWCRRAMLNIGPKALAFEEPPVRISRGEVELGAQINAPNTLALIVNQNPSGTDNVGEGYFCGVTNGLVDKTKDGFIVWNGNLFTVPRVTQGADGFVTNVSFRRGFIAFDTAGTKPFHTHAQDRDLAFVFKIGNQWYYDNNATPVSFTPTPDMVTLAWLQTGATDTIIGSGILSPTNLETAALPGADVTEDTPWARVGAQPSIVPNGDFEQDLAGWQIVEQTDLDPANTKIIDDAVEGKVLSFPNSGGDRAIGSLTFRVFPGQTYRAVIRARHLGTNTLEDGAYFRLNMKRQHAPVISNINRNQFHDFFSGANFVIKNSWDTYEYDYTIPAGMNYANLTFYNWFQSNIDFQIERMELMPLGGAAEWGANVTGNNIASGIEGQGSLATLNYSELYRWSGSQSIPVQTDFNGGYKFTFESDTDGPCRILIKAYDAEGGIHAGLNGVDLGSLKGPDQATLWYERASDALVAGTNTLSVWSVNTDGGSVREVEVHRDPYQQGISSAAATANWEQVSGPAPIDQAYEQMSYANGAEFEAAWTQTGGSIPQSEITQITDVSVPGGVAMRFGNNSGNDAWWGYLGGARMPYDPNALYEIGVIARRTAGSGIMYCGVNGKTADGTAVNVSGSNSHSSQHYIAANGVSPPSSWTTYRGYFGKQTSGGFGGPHNSPADPGRIHTNATYVEPMLLVNHDNQPGITDVAAVWLRKLTVAEFVDSRNARQSLVGGQSNAITTPYLSAVDAGSTATISISSHTRRYDFGDLTYNAGSIGGRSFSTRYYLYAEDGAFTGGNVTYQATTVHSNSIGVNRIYLGSITTPANGSTGGGGGGGFPDDCLAAHMLLSNGKYARDLDVGDMIDVMDDDMNHVGEKPVLALRHATQNCVELVTKSARVVVSTTAPVVTKERGTLTAPQVKGLTVAVRIKGVFGFEQVLDVIPVGEKPIVRISVGGISFSAGQESDRLIYTHNIYLKP